MQTGWRRKWGRKSNRALPVDGTHERLDVDLATPDHVDRGEACARSLRRAGDMDDVPAGTRRDTTGRDGKGRVIGEPAYRFATTKRAPIHSQL